MLRPHDPILCRNFSNHSRASNDTHFIPYAVAGPLKRLQENPVARLAHGFAYRQNPDGEVLLLRIVGALGTPSPYVDLDTQQFVCDSNIPSYDLAYELHQYYCQHRLEPLRAHLSSFGTALLDQLIKSAGKVWYKWANNGVQDPNAAAMLKSSWHDRTHNQTMTLYTHHPEEGVYALTDVMLYDLQKEILDNNFGWGQHIIPHGCTPDEQSQRLCDGDVLIRTALPIVTHIPGIRHSYLKDQIVETAFGLNINKYANTKVNPYFVDPRVNRDPFVPNPEARRRDLIRLVQPFL